VYPVSEHPEDMLAELCQVPAQVTPDERALWKQLEEAICAVRRIERLRTLHGLDMAMIKILFELFDEVERLRNEVRFLRTS